MIEKEFIKSNLDLREFVNDRKISKSSLDLNIIPFCK